MKIQSTEWEKTFGNVMTTKGLISKIYKHLIQLNINKSKQPLKNRQETLIDIFPKKTHRWSVMANGHMNRCATSLIIREMQI